MGTLPSYKSPHFPSDLLCPGSSAHLLGSSDCHQIVTNALPLSSPVRSRRTSSWAT